MPALRHSTAMNRGTWMHHRFQHYHLPTPRAHSILETIMGNRLSELSETCDSLGIQGEGKKAIYQREEKDHKCSLAWYEAAKTVPMNRFGGMSFEDFFLSPHWHRLGAEFRLVTSVRTDNRANPACCVAQPDLLLYHRGQNSVWIVDLKTTALDPSLRAMAIPVDFQTEHYMFSVKALLDTGQLQQKFGLPSDCRLGGMFHLIIKKPMIQMGMNDRDYMMDTSPFKSGPRKGLPRMEKKYQGEPRLENYIQRCADWYHATGDYLDKAAEWEVNPPVGISSTPASLVLDEGVQKRYRSRVQLIHNYGTKEPYPSNFPMSDQVFNRAELSTYSCFKLSSVEHWPGLMQSEGFCFRRRDEPIPEEIEFDILNERGSEFEE